MRGLFPGYRRPGISSLTLLTDAADAAALPDFLSATLPYVEEVVLLCADVDVELPPASDRQRIRCLQCSAHAWRLESFFEHQLHGLAELARHEWSVWLPVHGRLHATQWAKLRHRLPTLGHETLNFRLPGEVREHATYYLQSVWRTAWRLHPHPTGNLFGLENGEQSRRGINVVDSLDTLPQPPSYPDLLRQLTMPRSESAPVVVGGMRASGGTPLIRLLTAAGLAPGDDLVTREPGREGEWEDRQVRAVNGRLVQAAVDVDSEWPWSLSVSLNGSTFSPAIREQLAKTVAGVDSGPRRVFKDPLFGLTLSVWRRQIPGLACVVPVRNPLEVAAALCREYEIPRIDAVRLWRNHNELLLQQLARHDVPAVFVDYDRLLTEPEAAAGRLTTALGLACPPTTRWLASDRRHETCSGDLQRGLRELFGGEALAGEVPAIVELFDALHAVAGQQKISAPITSKQSSSLDIAPPTPPVTVVLHHHDSFGSVRPSLEALAGSTRVEAIAEVIVLSAGGEKTIRDTDLDSLPFPVSTRDCFAAESGHLTRELDQILGATCTPYLLFSRTDVTLEPNALEAHLQGHRRVTPQIVVGQVDGTTPGTLDDRALFCRNRISRADELFGETFPANSSVSRAVLAKVGQLDPVLFAGFEFVDLALRAHECGAEITYRKTARASRRQPPAIATVLTQQRAAGRGLIDFLEKWPSYFPRERLCTRVHSSRGLMGRYDEMADKVVLAQELARAGATVPPETRRQLDVATYQLAGGASVLGLTRSDPRVIRLLGRANWNPLRNEFGERWGDPTYADYEDRLAANQEQCRSLVGRHAGATAFICGTSPQLYHLTGEQKRRLGDHLVIGVNDAHYMLRPDYLLSAYYNRVAFARQQLDEAATVIHMRPIWAPPLGDGILSVRRRMFEGDLPVEFGSPPTIRTCNNVILGATHLALILGAQRLVYLGMELSTRLHFYSHDPELRQALINDFARLPDCRYFGVDHDYERHSRITREVYGKSAEVLLSYPNPFAPYDTAAGFCKYFAELNRRGVSYFATLDNSVLTEAGATFRPLDEFITDGSRGGASSGRLPVSAEATP
ncbi:MAG: sulfotransferase [bacterium]